MATGTEEQRTIRVGTVGIEGQEYTVLKVAMNLLAAHGINALLSENADSGEDVVVVDGDNESGKSYISGADGQALLVIASQEIPRSSGITQFETKPVRVQAVSNSLKLLCEKLPSKPAGKAPAKKAAPVHHHTHDLPKLVLAEAGNLFELLLAARQQHQALRIEGAPIGEVVVFPSSGVVGLSTDRKVLITNPALGTSALSVSEISDADAASFLGGRDTVDIGTLMWNMAIIGRHSQLPPGHSADTVVKLRAWPNFTRLGVGSNHINLSAVLTRQPMSLQQVAQVAKVPLEAVVAFYNGALSIGLIVAAKPQSEASAKDAARPTEKRRGLFAKIANRLASMKGE